MFTGIICRVGQIVAVQKKDDDHSLEISCDPFIPFSLGESVAINGVCLTVQRLTRQSFSVHISPETLRCTNIGKLISGSRVNLERAVTPTTLLGGHIVSGHVDGLGEVVSNTPEGASWHYEISVPEALRRYIARKGAVTVDGVSLTVNSVTGRLFSVTIVPHTYRNTTIEYYQPGTQVNIEVDMLARYVERLLSQQTVPTPLSSCL